MLERVEDGPAILVCTTCRFDADRREDETGRRGGALLADALEAALHDLPDASGVQIQRTACLFACAQHCTVHLRAPGKLGYVLGRFTPGPEAARALLDYARHYVASAEGVVPYADWPEGVKGHFLVRIPPEGCVTR